MTPTSQPRPQLVPSNVRSANRSTERSGPRTALASAKKRQIAAMSNSTRALWASLRTESTISTSVSSDRAPSRARCARRSTTSRKTTAPTTASIATNSSQRVAAVALSRGGSSAVLSTRISAWPSRAGATVSRIATGGVAPATISNVKLPRDACPSAAAVCQSTVYGPVASVAGTGMVRPKASFALRPTAPS